SWEVKRAIREQVKFATHNLMQPAPGNAFDIIMLCNVLIYFDERSKQQVLAHLIEALATGGYLLLGPSEGAFDLLGSLKRHASCVYQKV
ncbi:MAG: CheR family methyltransferase, partial [Planctomycetota bacterium]